MNCRWPCRPSCCVYWRKKGYGRSVQSAKFRSMYASSLRPIATFPARFTADIFGQYLFYRLDVMSMMIPPLRERRDDVLPLARYFMGQLSAQLGVPPITICDDIMQAMRVYAWPGNARELRNLIERSLILGKFPIGCVSPTSEPAPPSQAPVTLEEVEKLHILRVLDSVAGNKSEAARLLGISRKTLERKCSTWQVQS